eukprot:TRINITY_DN35252_c2_g1_i1.p1 TRINITY_DN35252_c2_g1~~TRINITY_DN35252_c2_g1_i1.p1  ORF type:complete len:181 (-),score=40.25 TRINITY_DN35252_c2_g1_i1:94-636(-)
MPLFDSSNGGAIFKAPEWLVSPAAFVFATSFIMSVFAVLLFVLQPFQRKGSASKQRKTCSSEKVQQVCGGKQNPKMRWMKKSRRNCLSRDLKHAQFLMIHNDDDGDSSEFSDSPFELDDDTWITGKLTVETQHFAIDLNMCKDGEMAELNAPGTPTTVADIFDLPDDIWLVPTDHGKLMY